MNRQTEPEAFRNVEEQREANVAINTTWDVLLAKSAAGKREAEAISDDEFLSAEEDVSVRCVLATIVILS